MCPTVSINLCCYNSEKYLEETLQSIFSQTYTDWELVIVNDGSGDSTETIVQKHISEGWPIVYEFQENAGLGNARNKALSLSRGAYIAFIDHDDIWLPRKLEKQIPIFEGNAGVGLVFCDSIFFDQRGRNWNVYRRRKPPRGYVFRELLARYFLSLETVVIRRAALASLDEWFDGAFTMVEDMDLFLRLAYYHEMDYVDEPLAKWRIHPESLTHTRYDRFAVEKEIMLKKFVTKVRGFEEAFGREVRRLQSDIECQKAEQAWRSGQVKACRALLRRHMWGEPKASVLFTFSFLPYWFYDAMKRRRRPAY